MNFNFPKDIIYKDAYKLSVIFEEALTILSPFLSIQDAALIDPVYQSKYALNDLPSIEQIPEFVAFREHIALYQYELLINSEIKT